MDSQALSFISLMSAPAAPDVVEEVKQTFGGVAAKLDQVHPQLKVLAGLLALYGLFLYLG